MLGVDACEFGGQVLELLWLTVCYRGLIADKKDLPIGEEEAERNLNYHPPALKSLQEILELNKDDESLVKYKETLLGMDPQMVSDNSSLPNVQVTRMTLLCDDAPEPITMDLTGDLKTPFVFKDGATYRIKLNFKVNREIVSGLRYCHVMTKKDINVCKASYMVGSYGPKAEEQEFLSPCAEAPKGMLGRGLYKVKSQLVDDDKIVHKMWEWQLNIEKDWN